MKNRKQPYCWALRRSPRRLAGLWAVTGAEQAEESSSAAGVAAFRPRGAVSVICYENEGGEIALEYRMTPDAPAGRGFPL